MSPEQLHGLAILEAVTKLSEEQRKAFTVALDRIQSAVKEGGEAGLLALAYVGVQECQK